LENLKGSKSGKKTREPDLRKGGTMVSPKKEKRGPRARKENVTGKKKALLNSGEGGGTRSGACNGTNYVWGALKRGMYTGVTGGKLQETQKETTGGSTGGPISFPRGKSRARKLKRKAKQISKPFIDANQTKSGKKRPRRGGALTWRRENHCRTGEKHRRTKHPGKKRQRRGTG